MNKKMSMLIAILCIVFLVGCTAAAFINFVLSIGIVGFVCNEVFPNDQALIQSDDGTVTITAASFCDSIVSLVLQTAAGTIEVRNQNGQWVILTSVPEQFDLMQLQGKQKVMVYKELPAGKYDKLRIDLDSIKIKTNDGKTYTTILPSKELVFDTNIEVNNQRTTVELNLDVAKSLFRTENNKIAFVPVMNIESRRNVNVEIIDKNKKLITVNGGSLLDNKNVGMDLNGEMRQNFVLSKNSGLLIKNNAVSSGTSKAIHKNPSTSSIQQSSQSSNQVTQTSSITKGIISATGITQINSIPSGASVKIDGITRGTTPLTIKLAQGSHLLKISNSGYKFYSSFINVGADGLINDFDSELNGRNEKISQSSYRIILNK